MKRAVTTATLSIVILVAVGCTADGPEGSEGPGASGPTVSDGSTPALEAPGTSVGGDRPTPSTLPTAIDPATTDRPGVEPRLPTGPFGTSRLAFFGDCAALLDHMQAEASARVTAWGLGGGGRWFETVGRAAGDFDLAADGAETTAGADRSALIPTMAPVEGEDYSGTNTQEVGVDEGDIVETDGHYVYTASERGVRIVEVASAAVVAELDLPGGSHQMILDGDRLLVATQSWNSGEDTIVSIYGVADPASPSLLRRSHLEGRLVASRSIDGVVRLVLSSSLDARLPFVWPDSFGFDEAGALARNREVIETSTVQDWLPRMFDEAGDGSFAPMEAALDCSTVAAPDRFSGLGVSWIASIDLDGDAAPTGSAGIVSSGETVYASSGSLYVATVPWDWHEFSDDAAHQSRQPATPPTVIHAFSLGGGTGASYVASGEVPGTLLNQFAMSEYAGVLRVATTVDEWDAGTSESAVYALRPNGDVLEPLSVVGGLGKGERIHAVRFLGPTAYVVTFRQIDPLYVIDMTDPTAPILDGELKIPGYSAYLHPVGDGLLLGVGQDATDEGIALGTQLSLFDVSDPTDPQRIDTLPIGGWSEVEWDHKAFLFWPADGTIVIPVSPGWGDCGPQESCLASQITSSGGGVVVARLDGRSLTGVGTIEHTTTGASQHSGCWNPLQRSIVIGGELVTVGLDRMRFSDRGDLTERATAAWGDADEFGCAWWWE